jgi:hypothetical protein
MDARQAGLLKKAPPNVHHVMLVKQEQEKMVSVSPALKVNTEVVV